VAETMAVASHQALQLLVKKAIEPEMIGDAVKYSAVQQTV
jgi:hypothetical protein